jgi:hypothetical protein
VRRQVYPKPSPFPPTPAYYTLQAGRGGEFERANLFCALALQAGLETAWVGPASAADFATLANVTPEGESPRSVPLPFAGLAVLSEGEAFVVPVSLAAPAGSGGYPKFDSAQGRLLLAPPLSRLAPRMAEVEQLLSRSRGVEISIEWPRLVAAWAAGQGGPMVWNAADDFTNPTRGLAASSTCPRGGSRPRRDSRSAAEPYSPRSGRPISAPART